MTETNSHRFSVEAQTLTRLHTGLIGSVAFGTPCQTTVAVGTVGAEPTACNLHERTLFTPEVVASAEPLKVLRRLDWLLN